jgi:hypothetical protein
MSDNSAYYNSVSLHRFCPRHHRVLRTNAGHEKGAESVHYYRRPKLSGIHTAQFVLQHPRQCILEHW